MVVVEAMIFQRKGNPETYPCLPSYLIAHLHNKGNSHCTDFNRPSGADTPFEQLGRYLAPILDLQCFFSSPKRFLYVGYSRAFLALLHGLIFLSLPLRLITPLAFLALWHFESVQECKECMRVITEIYADTAALSAFSAFSNSKMRIMQVMQMFFFSSPQSLNNSVQSYIYTPLTELNQNTKMKTDEKEEPSDVGRRVLKV